VNSLARALIAAQKFSSRLPGRRFSINTASEGEDFALRQSQTVPAGPADPSRPSVFQLFSVKEDGDDEDVSKSKEKMRSGGSLLAKMMGSSPEETLVEKPTVKDLKKWLVKPVNKDVSSHCLPLSFFLFFSPLSLSFSLSFSLSLFWEAENL